MYEPDTILVLKTLRSTEQDPFPYDRVRVVGNSPVNHAGAASEWVGANGQGVIIQPLDSFGTNLDEPFGKLAALYDVESVPEPAELEQKITIKTLAQQGPTPEEVFADAADGDSRKAKPPKVRKSPLKDPRPAPSASPLDGDDDTPKVGDFE